MDEQIKESAEYEQTVADTEAVKAEQTENGAEENQNNAENGNTEEKTSVKAEIISWVKTIVGAFVMAWIITTFIIVNAQVPSGSMENTVMTGDRLIANRLSYVVSEPKRFDIVVFKFPDDESKLYIKRIIGMPGDKVEIRDNKVYINDSTEPLDDSFTKEPMFTPDAVYEVPEGHYFMMGDNRNNSSDSRFWINTYVAKDKILGKAVFRYYPKPATLFDK